MATRPAPVRFPDDAWPRIRAGIRDEGSGLIAVSLVELATGARLESWCEHPRYDVIVAGALSSAVLRHKLRVLRAFSPKLALEDVLINVGAQLHVIRMVATNRLLYVVADGSITHFAAVRAFITRHVGAGA